MLSIHTQATKPSYSPPQNTAVEVGRKCRAAIKQRQKAKKQLGWSNSIANVSNCIASGAASVAKSTIKTVNLVSRTTQLAVLNEISLLTQPTVLAEYLALITGDPIDELTYNVVGMYAVVQAFENQNLSPVNGFIDNTYQRNRASMVFQCVNKLIGLI